MESWRTVWRQGFAPGLSTDGLDALHRALLEDDFRITQRVTTRPPASGNLLDCPADGACAITFCGWQGEGLATVGELDEFFSRTCFEADCRLGESAASRWFLNWYDYAPREEMRRALLSEVDRELAARDQSEDVLEVERLLELAAA